MDINNFLTLLFGFLGGAGGTILLDFGKRWFVRRQSLDKTESKMALSDRALLLKYIDADRVAIGRLQDSHAALLSANLSQAKTIGDLSAVVNEMREGKDTLEQSLKDQETCYNTDRAQMISAFQKERDAWAVERQVLEARVQDLEKQVSGLIEEVNKSRSNSQN